MFPGSALKKEGEQSPAVSSDKHLQRQARSSRTCSATEQTKKVTYDLAPWCLSGGESNTPRVINLLNEIRAQYSDLV